jgi:GT2 family glycosyltransferase
MNDTFSAVCIVLNYNDADTTIEQLSRIRGYGCFDAVIVVDNHSTDDSFVRLKDCTAGHVIFLEAGRNGGYGAGNNLGLKYAREILHARYALIANPDAEFTEKCVDADDPCHGTASGTRVILAPVRTTPDRGEKPSASRAPGKMS